MSKTITRQTLKLFGKDGATSNFGEFGSQAAGTPVTTKAIATIQSLTAWLNGWQDAVAAGQAPYLQDMNSLFYVLAYEQAYVLQEGVPEYDSGTTYFIGSIVKRPDAPEFYSSLSDSNVGNALPSAGSSNASWQFISGYISSSFRIGGPLAMNSQKVTGLAAGTTSGDALRYEQVIGLYLLLTGGTMSGAIAMGSNKITGLAAGTTAGDAFRYEQNNVWQYVQASDTTTLTTASATFVDTSLTASITPGSSARRVRVSVMGELSGINAGGYWTIKRNSTNIGDASSGFAQFRNDNAAIVQGQVGGSFIDSPASGSAVTYTVQVKCSSGTGIQWNRSNSKSTIILEEIT